MAESGTLSDAELAVELGHYGEQIQLPIQRNKRPILVKKLNHLRARTKAQEIPSQKGRSKLKPNPYSPPASGVKPRVGTRLSTNSDFTEEIEPSPSNSHSFRPSPARFSPQKPISEAPNRSNEDTDLRGVPYTRGSTSRAGGPPPLTPNHTNSRDRKREPQFPDSILRTLRRRTGELPPRRSRRSEIVEVAADSSNDFSNKQLDGSDDEINVPSPARSRLYPNLGRVTSFFSQSKDTENAFESSDSDLEEANISTYEVENKSVNTSFPLQSQIYPGTSYGSRDESRLNASGSSFGSFSSSPGTPTQRYRSRRASNRVQQYKSWYLESLPQLLVVVAALFFTGITVTYISTHKDYFLSWFSSSSNMGKLLSLILKPFFLKSLEIHSIFVAT